MAIGITRPAATITPLTTAVAASSDRAPAFHSALAWAGGNGAAAGLVDGDRDRGQGCAVLQVDQLALDLLHLQLDVLQHALDADRVGHGLGASHQLAQRALLGLQVAQAGIEVHELLGHVLADDALAGRPAEVLDRQERRLELPHRHAHDELAVVDVGAGRRAAADEPTEARGDAAGGVHDGAEPAVRDAQVEAGRLDHRRANGGHASQHRHGVGAVAGRPARDGGSGCHAERRRGGRLLGDAAPARPARGARAAAFGRRAAGTPGRAPDEPREHHHRRNRPRRPPHRAHRFPSAVA